MITFFSFVQIRPEGTNILSEETQFLIRVISRIWFLEGLPFLQPTYMVLKIPNGLRLTIFAASLLLGFAPMATPEHIAIYAEVLGHSIEELMTIYNKMHPADWLGKPRLPIETLLPAKQELKSCQSPGSLQTALSAAQMSPQR
jgi:hypothetical protein